MILLDTQSWIWWVSLDPRLSRAAREAADMDREIRISVVSCWEVAMLAGKGRIGLGQSVESWIRDSLRSPDIQLVGLDVGSAVRAAAFGPSFPRDPADRLIAATALTLGCPLVTSDRPIRASGEVPVIW